MSDEKTTESTTAPVTPAVAKAMEAFHGGRALLAENAALKAEVARLSACLEACSAEDEHILPGEIVAIHLQWQCDWDGAAVNDAGLDRLRGAAIRLAGELAISRIKSVENMRLSPTK